MGSALHHLHRRIRIHKKHEKFPHPNKLKRSIDILIYVMAILGPVIAIPQIIKIWVDKSAAGVSIVPWIGFLLGSIIWMIYGILHKEKPIIITNALWIIANSFIVFGVIMYG